MLILRRTWEACCGILSKILAGIYNRQALEFEKSGVAARRRELIATVPRGGCILEVGAGTGSTLAAGAYTEPAGRFGRIVMSEPDEGMRSKLIERVENTTIATKIEVADSELPVLPYDDATFDAVACFMVLSHVHERCEALREISRVLRVGGRLLLLDHGAHEHHHDHGGGHGGGRSSGHSGGHGSGHDNGQSHSGSEVQSHDHSHGGQTGGHAHGGERRNKRQFFWFKEWFSFVFWRRPKNAKIQVLLEDFYKEPRLREDFTSRMQITRGYFKELCYGTFTRVE